MQCPFCNVGRPHEPKYDTVTVVGVGFAIALGAWALAQAWPAARRTTQAEGTAYVAPASTIDSQRVRDSITAFLPVSGTSLGALRDSIATDSLIHNARFAVSHEALHRRVIDVRLQAARANMTADNSAGWRFAAAQLAEIRSPLTPGQETVRQGIEARVQRAERTAAARQAREARRAFVATYERELLLKGYDVTVSATGTDGTTLRIKWILVSRPLAYQVSNNTEWNAHVRALGFTRVVLSDGYDKAWSWSP